jgi:hypothetical protein
VSSTAWATETDLPSLTVAPPTTPELIEEALEFASFVVWRLSGMLYAPVQLITEAYDTRLSLCMSSQIYPIFLQGSPYNIAACSQCACSNCGVFHRTRLRGYPIRGVYDVWADGIKLADNEYVVLDNSVLGLTTSKYCNVRCLVVRYAYGTGVPPGGRAAVAKLADQLLLSARGEDCDLPARVTSVSRQGVSWTLLDPQDFIDQGRTGIYEIDMLLHALNPSHALARPRVFSPDLPRASVILAEEPPLSVLIDPGDQVVIAGEQTTWTTQDPDIISALNASTPTSTEVGGQILSNTWTLAADGTSASLVVTGPETAVMADLDPYTVLDTANDTPLLWGKVHVL